MANDALDRLREAARMYTARKGYLHEARVGFDVAKSALGCQEKFLRSDTEELLSAAEGAFPGQPQDERERLLMVLVGEVPS